MMQKQRFDEDTQARLLGEMIAAKQEALRKAVKPVNIRKFLKFLSDFYRLSYDNQMILYAKNPEAQCVAGFNAWLNLGRHVKENEKPVYIFTDSVTISDPGQPAIDTDGRSLVLSDSGVPVYDEEPTYQDLVIPIPVYDVMQTEPDEDSNGEVVMAQPSPDFFDYISSQALLVTQVDKMNEAHKFEGAYYDGGENEIIIRKDLPAETRNQELLRAYIQYVFQTPDSAEMSPGGPDVRDCRFPDIAIECVAWMLNEHYGLKQTVRTFGDLAAYEGIDDTDLDTDLRIISFYSQRIMQHLEGFTLSFDETLLLNQLMTDDNGVRLDDLYHRLLSQFDIPDPVKSAIAHVFEELTVNLSDTDRASVYEDRLKRKIMTFPPYELKGSGDNAPKGTEMATLMETEELCR